MDPQAAGELVEAWVLAPGAGTPRDHGPVSRSVRALAPDAEFMGVGETNLGGAMAVLVEGALLVLEVRHPVAEAPPTVIASRVRLDDRVDLVVEETYEQADGVQVCRRVWKLDAPSLSFRLRGAEALSGDGPDANERLGRAIAAALGWPTP